MASGSMAADGRAVVAPAATDRGVKQGRDGYHLLESSPPDHAVSYCASGYFGYNEWPFQHLSCKLRASPTGRGVGARSPLSVGC